MLFPIFRGPQAVEGEGAAVLGIRAEDAIGLGNGMPALDVVKPQAIAGTNLNVFVLQLGLERAELFVL